MRTPRFCGDAPRVPFAGRSHRLRRYCARPLPLRSSRGGVVRIYPDSHISPLRPIRRRQLAAQVPMRHRHCPQARPNQPCKSETHSTRRRCSSFRPGPPMLRPAREWRKCYCRERVPDAASGKRSGRPQSAFARRTFTRTVNRPSPATARLGNRQYDLARGMLMRQELLGRRGLL